MEQTVQKQRLHWLDVEKGLAMLMVFWGHFGLLVQVNTLIYAVHMPLFFFLSGLVWNGEKYTSAGAYVRNKFLNVLLPVLIYNTIVFLIEVVKALVMGEPASLWKSLIGIFLEIRLAPFYTEGWFVSCMFATLILMYLLNRICKGDKNKMMLLATCSMVAGYLYIKLIGQALPMNLDAASIAIFFLCAGYWIKPYLDTLCEKVWLILLALVIYLGCAGLNGWFCRNVHVDMWGNYYGKFVLFVPAACCGILVFVKIAKWISKCSWLEKIGKNTLYLYLVHAPIKSAYVEVVKQYQLMEQPLLFRIVVSTVLTFGLCGSLYLLHPLYDQLLAIVQSWFTREKVSV